MTARARSCLTPGELAMASAAVCLISTSVGLGSRLPERRRSSFHAKARFGISLRVHTLLEPQHAGSGIGGRVLSQRVLMLVLGGFACVIWAPHDV